MIQIQDTTKQLFLKIRKRTEEICSPLKTEDYVLQPVEEVSPPKWHLAHTTWFFEEFVLGNLPDYKRFDEDFAYLFNSYYNQVGDRVLRPNRGLMSRPRVDEIYAYRAYVDTHMEVLLAQDLAEEVKELVLLGLNHEQQHQELLLTDIKYILGHQPLFPTYGTLGQAVVSAETTDWVKIAEGVYEIGYKGTGFSFDNEHNRHKVYLNEVELRGSLVSNAEFLAFINARGYEDFNLWHAEGWDWVQKEQIKAPMYWHKKDGSWWYYELDGFKLIDPTAAVKHISFYEASAFANWKGLRLPTESEWEVASAQLNWGERWEWTNSAYLPYPAYRKADGAIGEYNGKFMVNQMVLRGGSVATAKGHSRPTYRNFFHPDLRWQFTGLRLAKDLK